MTPPGASATTRSPRFGVLDRERLRQRDDGRLRDRIRRVYACPLSAAADAMLTITPRVSSRCGTRPRQEEDAREVHREHAAPSPPSADVGDVTRSCMTPATLQSTSSLPKRSTQCATRRAAAASRHRGGVCDVEPVIAARSRRPRCRSPKTRAPSAARRSAVARPMPAAAPVTRATLPGIDSSERDGSRPRFPPSTRCFPRRAGASLHRPRRSRPVVADPSRPRSRPTSTKASTCSCVGLGCAGARVALEASRAGAETLVLERAGGGGGTSAMSGGVLYLGGGTALQKACGFEDSPEEMFKYLMASCGDGPDEAKLRALLRGLRRALRLARRPGRALQAESSTTAAAASRRPTTGWSGRAPSARTPSASRARPRRAVTCRSSEHQAGPMLMRKLVAAVEASPARIAPNHRCVALVRERDGAIVGASCRVVRRGARDPRASRRRPHDRRLHQQRGDARGAPAAGAALQLPRRRRRRRRQRHPARGRGRRRDAPHGQGLDLAAGDAALGSQARHPGQRAGPALHQRGRLLRPPRRGGAVPPRRSRLAGRRRRRLREARVPARARRGRRDRRPSSSASSALPAGQPRERRSRSTTATPSAARTRSSTSCAST